MARPRKLRDPDGHLLPQQVTLNPALVEVATRLMPAYGYDDLTEFTRVIVRAWLASKNELAEAGIDKDPDPAKRRL